MRTAKDIVRDYKERGYDTFRLRALAALRPEPMRSQILAILDEEASERSAADEESGIETATDSVVTPSGIMEAVGEDMVMDEPEEATLDCSDSDIVTGCSDDVCLVSDIEMNDKKMAEAVAEEVVLHSEEEVEGTDEEMAEENREGEINSDMEIEVGLENTGSEMSSEDITVQADEVAEVKEDNAVEIEESAAIQELTEAQQSTEVEEQGSSDCEVSDFWEVESAMIIDSVEEEFEPVSLQNSDAEIPAVEAENSSEEVAEEGSSDINPDTNKEESVDVMAAFTAIEEQDSEGINADENVLTQDILDEHKESVEGYERNLQLAGGLSMEQESFGSPENSNAIDEQISEVDTSITSSGENKIFAFEEISDAVEVVEEVFDVQDADTLESEKDAEEVTTAGSEESHLCLLKKGDNVTGGLDEDTVTFGSDEHILYMFNGEKQYDDDTLESVRLSLFKGEEECKEESEWYDYGSGLIVFPKDMHDQHVAINDAMREEPLVVDSGKDVEADVAQDDKLTLDQLVQHVQENKASLDGVYAIDDLIADIESREGDGECKSAEAGEFSAFSKDVEAVAFDSSQAVDIANIMGVKANEVMSTDKSAEGSAEMVVDQSGKSMLDTDRYMSIKSELESLQSALETIEKSLHIKNKEVAELSELVQQKDEIIELQKVQVEEARGLALQYENTIKELEAGNNRMHEVNEQIMRLRIEKEELERERNILKTDVIPGFEDQQLELVAMVEEENRTSENLRKSLNAGRRKVLMSYTLAAAATICVAVIPLLNWMAGKVIPATQKATPQVLTLKNDDYEKTISEQASQLASIMREKDALHEALRMKEASWKEREGKLLHKISLKEEALAMRERGLAEQLNIAIRERDSAVNRLARVSHTSNDNRAYRSNSGDAGARILRAAVTQSNRNRAGKYVVKSGDTLSEIVRNHYGHTKNGALVKRVAKSNGLRNPNDLRVGQILQLAAVNDD